MLYIYIVIVQLYTKNVPTANTKQENLSDFCFFDTVDASLWAKVATPALILSYARFLEDCDHGKSHETSAFKGGLIVSYFNSWQGLHCYMLQKHTDTHTHCRLGGHTHNEAVCWDSQISISDIATEGVISYLIFPCFSTFSESLFSFLKGFFTLDTIPVL